MMTVLSSSFCYADILYEHHFYEHWYERWRIVKALEAKLSNRCLLKGFDEVEYISVSDRMSYDYCYRPTYYITMAARCVGAST